MMICWRTRKFRAGPVSKPDGANELKDRNMIGSEFFELRRIRANASWRIPASASWSLRAALAVCLAIALTAVLGNLSPASAQRLDRFTRSYVTPFPQNDRYRVVVFGDSLGDGIWQGLYEAFKDDSNVEVIKRSRGSTGFTYRQRNNWNSRIKGVLKSDRVHVAVVMVGASDMRSIRRDGQAA